VLRNARQGGGRPSARSTLSLSNGLTVRCARYIGASDGAPGTRKARAWAPRGSARLTKVPSARKLEGPDALRDARELSDASSSSCTTSSSGVRYASNQPPVGPIGRLCCSIGLSGARSRSARPNMIHELGMADSAAEQQKKKTTTKGNKSRLKFCKSLGGRYCNH
jgi:hypothetical protein